VNILLVSKLRLGIEYAHAPILSNFRIRMNLYLLNQRITKVVLILKKLLGVIYHNIYRQQIDAVSMKTKLSNSIYPVRIWIGDSEFYELAVKIVVLPSS
jgi:hypothetical protein